MDQQSGWCRTKKIKSRGIKEFNYTNEFITERILFFGNNANRVKTVNKKSCISKNLIAILRFYFKDEAIQIANLNAKIYFESQEESKSPQNGMEIWPTWNGRIVWHAIANGIHKQKQRRKSHRMIKIFRIILSLELAAKSQSEIEFETMQIVGSHKSRNQNI